MILSAGRNNIINCLLSSPVAYQLRVLLWMRSRLEQGELIQWLTRALRVGSTSAHTYIVSCNIST